MRAVRVTAKVDYALRAVLELAGTAPSTPVKGDVIAEAQGISVNYLENILLELRRAGIVRSQRGAEGGYWLARPADKVTVADIIRAVEGPLANVRGERPEALEHSPADQIARDLRSFEAERFFHLGGHPVEIVGADGPPLGRQLEPGDHLGSIERLSVARALHDGERQLLEALEGGEPLLTGQARTAAADEQPVLGLP